jgi:hypothetical protein
VVAARERKEVGGQRQWRQQRLEGEDESEEEDGSSRAGPFWVCDVSPAPHRVEYRSPREYACAVHMRSISVTTVHGYGHGSGFGPDFPSTLAQECPC